MDWLTVCAVHLVLRFSDFFNYFNSTRGGIERQTVMGVYPYYTISFVTLVLDIGVFGRKL